MTHVTGPWRKSSRSGQSNGTNCVEARATATWRKSSHSGGNASNGCVEARFDLGQLQLSDSQYSDIRPIMDIDRSDYLGFIASVKAS